MLTLLSVMLQADKKLRKPVMNPYKQIYNETYDFSAGQPTINDKI